MELLTSLALLACPIGMGAMMWFMMRGNKTNAASAAPAQRGPEVPPSLEALQEERRRLEQDIERLEGAEGGRSHS